jgi:hypothetical protein
LELGEAGRQQFVQSLATLGKKRCHPERVYFSFDRWPETLLELVPVRDHDRILPAKREQRIGESLRR